MPGLFWFKRPVGASVLGIAGKSGSSNIDHATSPPCADAPTHQRTNVPSQHRNIATSQHRNIASVARLLGGDDRDRPGSREPVATHGVITGTFKNATSVIETSIRIAAYGITARNYFGTGTKCE